METCPFSFEDDWSPSIPDEWGRTFQKTTTRRSWTYVVSRDLSVTYPAMGLGSSHT
jgi:hypothetical protein